MTSSQRRVFDAVREIGSDGWPVSVREVCERVGLASPSTAHMHLKALERAGHVHRSPRGERSGYCVVEGGPIEPPTRASVLCEVVNGQ